MTKGIRLWFLTAAVSGLAAGCGWKTNSDRAQSQVGVLAERLSQNVGEDGWFKRPDSTTTDADPWGSPLEIKYQRSRSTETLTVWSNGPDRLPHTRDDIGSHAYTIENTAALQGRVEGLGASASRGLVKGAVQGWKDRNK